MLIGSRQRLSTFHTHPNHLIDDAPVKHVHDIKSLGVYIDENMSWDIHVNSISKKISAGIGALKRCRPFLPQETLIYIFNAIVRPHFDYCDIVWGNCNNTLASKLQTRQNRAARILTFSSFDCPSKTLLEKLGWKTLESQRECHLANMMYKSLNGLAPDYLRNKFTDRSTISRYELRDSKNKLAIPMPRTNFLKNSFSYKGAILWNSLPSDVRTANSIQEFKTKFNDYFCK